jgi:Cu(I)/Ag(I) efflux system membrane fusion protein
MWTGKRSGVYVKSSAPDGFGFLMREVVIGPSMGDSIVIQEGLQEGEEIATHGTFSIDAAAQLAGKPSMMNAKTSSTGKYNLSKAQSDQVKKVLGPIYDAYFTVKEALTKDDLAAAQKAAKHFQQKLTEINNLDFKEEEATQKWKKMKRSLTESSEAVAQSKDLKKTREAFLQLSNTMVALTRTFAPLDQTIFIQHCPMADQNNGADWLSREKEIRNPYFGPAMLKCGEIKQEIKQEIN